MFYFHDGLLIFFMTLVPGVTFLLEKSMLYSQKVLMILLHDNVIINGLKYTGKKLSTSV
jgi:hypothetical protein